MHLIDIILIAGAACCYSIAFLIASTPVPTSKKHLKSTKNMKLECTPKQLLFIASGIPSAILFLASIESEGDYVPHPVIYVIYTVFSLVLGYHLLIQFEKIDLLDNDTSTIIEVIKSYAVLAYNFLVCGYLLSYSFRTIFHQKYEPLGVKISIGLAGLLWFVLAKLIFEHSKSKNITTAY